MLTSALKTQIADWYKQLQKQVVDFIPRPAQRQMIAEVAKTLTGEAGRHLVIEAPTGIGKTLSYLLPGIAVARADSKTLVVSTANVALQDQIFSKDLPLLSKFIPELRFVAAFGRRRYVCPRNLYFVSDDQLQQPDLLWLIEQQTTTQLSTQPRTTKQKALFERLQQSLDAKQWDGVRDHSVEWIDDQLWEQISTDKTRCLGHHCQWYQECPFFLARREIEQADVVVANHALVMAALESESVLPAGKDLLVVIDEGHHLPDVARDALEVSCEITPEALQLQTELFTRQVDVLRSQFTLKSPPPLADNQRLTDHCAIIGQHIEEISQQLLPVVMNRSDRCLRFSMGQLPEGLTAVAAQLAKLFDALRSVCENLLNFLGEQTGKADMVRIQRGLLQLNRFFSLFESQTKLWRLASTLENSGAPVSKWATLSEFEGKPQLWLHCAGIRVSEQLQKIVWHKVPHLVITSATLRSLNSFQRFQELSGLSEKATDRFMTLESPFNHAQQGKLIIPQMQYEPDFAQEAMHLKEMAAIFRKKIADTHAKGILVLFSSMRALKIFVEQLSDLRLTLLVQGDQPRGRLVALHGERIAQGKQSILIGLQSFSEGLDLKGELLSQVHIHKVAFPPVDSPVIITEGEWLKSLNRYPFEIQSLPGASFTLIQQVGRLIRSHHCFGEIVIYDSRLITRRYGSRLLAALPIFPIEQPKFELTKAESYPGKKTQVSARKIKSTTGKTRLKQS